MPIYTAAMCIVFNHMYWYNSAWSRDFRHIKMIRYHCTGDSSLLIDR